MGIIPTFHFPVMSFKFSRQDEIDLQKVIYLIIIKVCNGLLTKYIILLHTFTAKNFKNKIKFVNNLYEFYCVIIINNI
jgi:hypothetical protein